MKEVEKRSLLIVKEFSLSAFDTFENEILVELESISYIDLENMVHGTKLSYNQTVDILDKKSIGTKANV